MMKKKIIKILIIVFAIAVITVVWFITRKNTSYVIIQDGYSSYKSRIISNYQEYIEFANFIDSENKAYGKVYHFNTKKYNEEYFNNKSLAIINIVTGNSSNTLKNIDISILDNILVCKANIDYGNGIQDDIKGKLLLVEIDKSVTDFKIEK